MRTTVQLQRKKYFGSASFYKRVLFIALPVMAQQLIQNMVSLIDNFMVSGLGDVKMSGVNITGQILFIFMVLMNTVWKKVHPHLMPHHIQKKSNLLSRSFFAIVP